MGRRRRPCRGRPYVLSLRPALGVLSGRVRPLVQATLLLLVMPLAWSIREAGRLTRTGTRVAAYEWIQRHRPDDSRVAAESSTGPWVAVYRL